MQLIGIVSSDANKNLKLLLDVFPSRTIINLKSRPDRRARVTAQLQSFGLNTTHEDFSFFEAKRFADDGGFPTIGARGCFESHLAVLRLAAKADAPSLICEDDVYFLANKLARARDLIQSLKTVAWDMVYVGSRPVDPPQGAGLVPHQGPITCLHCYGVTPAFAAQIADYLEASLHRETGHPEGGRIHVDGAFNDYRRKHPGLKTLIFNPPLADQFSSRSDLGTAKWYDEAPILGGILELARRMKTATLK